MRHVNEMLMMMQNRTDSFQLSRTSFRLELVVIALAFPIRSVRKKNYVTSTHILLMSSVMSMSLFKLSVIMMQLRIDRYLS